jgi:hypothetical protein
MVDFDFGQKTVQNNGSQELTEIVDASTYANPKILKRESAYKKYWSKDMYSHITSKSFKDRIEDKLFDIKDGVIANKGANLAMLGGFGFSLFTNYLSGTIAGEHHFTYSGIDWVSFLSEAIPHAIVSGIILWDTYTKAGLSKKDRWINMALVGATTTLLSLGIYKPFRDIISNHYLDIGNPAGKATLKAQLWLIGEYMILSSTATYYILKKFGRLELMKKRKREVEANLAVNTLMNNETVVNYDVKNAVDEIVDKYINQEYARKRNGHSVHGNSVIENAIAV